MSSSCLGKGQPFTESLERGGWLCWAVGGGATDPALPSSLRADSVAWNPHKLLAAGLQCSALLLRDTSVGLPSAQAPALPAPVSTEGSRPQQTPVTLPAEARVSVITLC